MSNKKTTHQDSSWKNQGGHKFSMLCIGLPLSIMMFISAAFWFPSDLRTVGYLYSLMTSIATLAYWIMYMSERQNVQKSVRLDDTNVITNVQNAIEEHKIPFKRFSQSGLLTKRLFLLAENFEVKKELDIKIHKTRMESTLIVLCPRKGCVASFKEEIINILDNAKWDTPLETDK